MTVFLITLGAFLLVVAAMSIGVVISGKRIQGSCGGLGAAAINAEGGKVCGYCGINFEQKGKCGKE